MSINLKSVYIKRSYWVHKGDYGYVLIVAGSARYTGSPIFNAVSALKSGADLITIIGPERAMDVAANFLPDIITVPLKGDYLAPCHISKILDLAKSFDSLVIGGGLGGEKQTQKAILEIIKNIDLPIVIDASAISPLKGNYQILKNKKVIITPNSPEFYKLTGEEVEPILKDRKEKVKKYAARIGATILLKGNVDVISDGHKLALNKTGSVYMTKGGFGDILAGICGTLLARGLSPFEAAQAAAYINGKAGKLAAKKYGEGLLASDIFDFIPFVYNA